MKTALVVFGTRPEAIKMAPLVKALRAESGFRTVVCSTGQHREMLGQVLDLFEIKPDYDLDIMREAQDLFSITTSTLEGLKRILPEIKPDVLLTQGDTTTAFVSGLAAFYMKIPLAHVEAGLRTRHKYEPYPEEINRHLLSVIADYHFAPTEAARQNLLSEGTSPDRVWVTGNTVIDALLHVDAMLRAPERGQRWAEHFQREHGFTPGAAGQRMVLVTMHRRESFGEGMRRNCEAMVEITQKRPDVHIVFPVHLNPNVQGPVKELLRGAERIHLIPPQPYEPFVYLMGRSRLILTDSGGVQEEAPSLGKPVLVMRERTERTEGVDAGTVALVGTDKQKIVGSALELLDNQAAYEKMARASNPYGDGLASKRIVEILRG